MPKQRRLKASDACPCGSGKTTAECHRINTLLPLRVVEEPADGTTLLPASGVVAFVRPAELPGPSVAMCCGSCWSPLAVGAGFNQIKNIVIRCPGCGVFNQSYRYTADEPGRR